MAMKDYTIKEFLGVDQSKSENRLDPGSSPDACNMDTENGDLAVAKGFARYLPGQITAVPGDGTVRRLYIWRDLVTIRYIVIAGREVYAFVDTEEAPAWRVIYTYPETDGVEDHPPFAGVRWDFLESKIRNENYLIIACGESQMIKWNGKSEEAELFGSGEAVLETTVSAYADNVVTLAGEITEEAESTMLRTGITIKGLSYSVASVDRSAKKVTLSEEPEVEPKSGDKVKIGGGLSDAQVNFVGMHYGRLFACGDRDNPSRLYWSQPPGDSRSIEDWSMDDASENASGGHVEVGNTSTDPIMGMCALSNQLLIFKRDSIYRLLGDRPNNYRIHRVYAEVEQMTNSGLVVYGDTPFWMTKAGMYLHDGMQSAPMRNARCIRTFLAGVNLGMCKAAENRDQLYFTCRESGSGLDDAMIVYDVPDKTYMIRRGFRVADICAAGGEIYMINEKRVIYLFNTGDTYDGDPIYAYWNTPLSDLDNKVSIKEPQELYMRMEGKNAAIILEVTAGEHVQHHRYLTPTSINKVLEIPLKNEGRVFSIRLSNENGSQWKIVGGMQLALGVRLRTV